MRTRELRAPGRMSMCLSSWMGGLAWSTIAVLLFHPVHAWALDGGVTKQDGGPTIEAAYCARMAECGAPTPEAASVCEGTGPGLELARGVDADICRELVTAIEAEYACRTPLSCADFSNPADTHCAAESRDVLERFLAGAGLCLHGRVYVDVPDEWTCNVFYYGGADECDCGCGVVDPDCESGGCSGSGCWAPGCVYCYAEGEDVQCAIPKDGGSQTVEDAGASNKKSDPEPGCTSIACSTTERPSALYPVVVILCILVLPRIRRAANRKPSTDSSIKPQQGRPA